MLLSRLWLQLCALIMGSLLLFACTSEEPQLTVIDPSTDVENAPVAPVEKIIQYYQCQQNIGEIEVRFFPIHGVAVLILDGHNHELQQQIAASGFWYSNAKYHFRG